MNYRTLGSTGIKVSEIGLGCEGFVGRGEKFAAELMNAAITAGINCLDLYSPDPDVRSFIGNALRGRRDDFVLQAHLCTVWQGGQYKCTRKMEEIVPSFEDLLARLETD